MSKLDWFTIILITVCAIAIAVLLYNIFGDRNETNTSNNTIEINENYIDPEAGAEDPVISIDGDGDGDAVELVDKLEEAPTHVPNVNEDLAHQPMEPAEAKADKIIRHRLPKTEYEGQNPNTDTKHYENESPVSEKVNQYTGGHYMVLIGSYEFKASAQRMLKQLDQKGYSDAEIKYFDKGKFARVLVGRRNSYSDAQDLQADLLGDGFRDIIVVEKK